MAGNGHSKPEPKYQQRDQQDKETERQEDRWFLWQLAQRATRYATQMVSQTRDSASSSDTAPTTSVSHSKHDKCNVERNSDTDTDSVASSRSSEYLSAQAESLDICEDTSRERGTMPCETHHSSKRDTSQSIPTKESTTPTTLEYATTHTGAAVNKEQRKSIDVSSIENSTAEQPKSSSSEHSSEREIFEKGDFNDSTSSITRQQEIPPLPPHQASQINAHQSFSFPPANAGQSSAKISATTKTIMDESHIPILLGALAIHADKWDMIGSELGFQASELGIIRAKPTLFSGAPNSWLIEMLTRWVQWTPDTLHGKYATLQDLVKALQSDTVGLARVAERIRTVFNGEPRQSSEQGSSVSFEIPPSPSDSAIEWYIFYLRSYFTHNREPADKWPGIEVDKYIRLAVINNQYLQHKAYENFRVATVHGSIDDIVEGKAPIQMSDLFKRNFMMEQSRNRKYLMKRLLVEGAPGIGKSTMSWEICQKWGTGELFQEFSLVVMLRFRDPWVQQVKSISDLFHFPGEPEMQQEVAMQIRRSQGSGVLLILEGYDEAPLSLRKTDSLFFQLFTGRLLPNATVMVTTRPSASSDLRVHCSGELSRRIEVLGFGKKEINEYIECHFDKRKTESEDFYKYLELYPHIHSMMYVPLNSAIVTRVYDSCKTNSTIVPQTMTQLYTALVKTLLLRYMKERPEYRDIQISDFSDLPLPVLEKFHRVCKLAFQGITSAQTKVIFSDLPKDFDSLGLMQSVPELYIDKGTSVSHNFLHLTIQEYLAAYHLSLLSEDEQVTFLRVNLNEKPQCHNFLQVSVIKTCLQFAKLFHCHKALQIPVKCLFLLSTCSSNCIIPMSLPVY